MLKIASFLDKRCRRPDPSIYHFLYLDLATWGSKNRFNGIVINDDLICLDSKSFATFRVKIANLGTIPHKIVLHRLKRPSYDQQYIEKYFKDNHDNPYGWWNVCKTVFLSSIQPTELTQFPPLTYLKNASKQSDDIKIMREQALPGDMVFTFDRLSGLAQLIRRYDRGMWSHVAMVNSCQDIIESTTSGVVESPFYRLCNPRYDVGLYRHIDIEKDGKGKLIADSMQQLVGIKGYGWKTVFRIFLQKKYRIPFKRGPNDCTPSEIMYGNKLKLICFA